MDNNASMDTFMDNFGTLLFGYYSTLNCLIVNHRLLINCRILEKSFLLGAMSTFHWLKTGSIKRWQRSRSHTKVKQQRSVRIIKEIKLF